MLVCLDLRRSIRCFCFPFEKTTFELNFSATETACCCMIHVCFDHCVVRDRFQTIPKRDDASRSANLLRDLFQVNDMIVAKSLRFVSEMLRIRSIGLMCTSGRLRTHEKVVLKHGRGKTMGRRGVHVKLQCCKLRLVLGTPMCLLVNYRPQT